MNSLNNLSTMSKYTFAAGMGGALLAVLAVGTVSSALSGAVQRDTTEALSGREAGSQSTPDLSDDVAERGTRADA